MKKIFCLLLLLLLLATGCGQGSGGKDAAAGGSYTVTDEHGTVTTFKQAPQKVLTLALSSDGIVMGLGMADKLVAVNYLADDPVSSNLVEQAKKIQHKIKNPSAEEVLALKPDVVFAYDWSDMNRIENLRNLGMNVIVLKGPATIDDIRRNVRTIAKAMHADAKGEELIKLMDSRLAQVKQQVAALRLQQPKKIVLVSLMSSYGGKGCIFDDMCKEAGVINGVSVAGLKNGQQVTKEMLVKIDPDLLIMPVYNDHGNFDIKKYNEEFLGDPSLQTMRAIKNKQLFYPNEGYIYNCSQDVVFGVQEIAHAAYGEAFAMQGAQHLRVK